MPRPLKPEKCLVTGGAGFIGSHLVETLLKAGYSVRVLDNFSTGKRDNLFPYLNEIELVEGDIRNFNQVQNACAGMDTVFHQAAVASVTESMTEPQETHHINVDGTVNILEAARKNSIPKVIFASSAAVYGANSGLPKSEDMQAQPVSPYGLHKHVGEQYCEVYSRLFGLQVTCLRYFNVFGPRQNPHSQYSGAISIFIEKVLTKKQVIIYGDGQQSRDFIHVTDICQANLLAMQRQSSAFEIFNVGGGQSHDLLEVLTYISQHSSLDFERSYQPERRGDLRHSVADISKIKSNLDFKIKMTFEAGLRELISHSLKSLEPVHNKC